MCTAEMGREREREREIGLGGMPEWYSIYYLAAVFCKQADMDGMERMCVRVGWMRRLCHVCLCGCVCVLRGRETTLAFSCSSYEPL